VIFDLRFGTQIGEIREIKNLRAFVAKKIDSSFLLARTGTQIEEIKKIRKIRRENLNLLNSLMV
jgi:hypothetical protein